MFFKLTFRDYPLPPPSPASCRLLTNGLRAAFSYVIGGWFFPDLVSTIPFDSLVRAFWAGRGGGLKLVRVVSHGRPGYDSSVA